VIVVFHLNADVYQYNARSDGIRKIYTNDDELKEYGNRGILDPASVSYFNLFINGVLQPKVNYEIEKGHLLLKTEDVPVKGTSLILSFVTLKNRTSSKLNYATAEGLLPSGNISIGPVADMDIVIQDNVASYLRLEKNIIQGPDSILTGQIATWEFMITVKNISTTQIRNLHVTDHMLLDSILGIESRAVSQGNIRIEDHRIHWDMDFILPGDSVTASFQVEGCFTASGIRCISSGTATGHGSFGAVTTDIVPSPFITVGKGLFINKVITSGPTKVSIGENNRWRVELSLWNHSHCTISNILITDSLWVDALKDIRVIGASLGNATLQGNKLLWHMDVLEEFQNAILVVDIIGSFESEGIKNLNTASGVGNIGMSTILTNTAQDFQILVLPALKPQKKALLVKCFIYNESLAVFTGQSKKWHFVLQISNPTDHIVQNIMVTDTILFDELHQISAGHIPLGHAAISHNTILWTIEKLLPGTTLRATFEAEGSFNTTGLRSLNRAIATATALDSCIISNIASGPSIQIFDPVQDLQSICILADKVFSQCHQKRCLENITIAMDNNYFKQIRFQPGSIVENTLKITELENRPNLKRVRFQVKIPFGVVTSNGVIQGFLPTIAEDILMFIPESRDEFSYRIVVDTSTKLLEVPLQVNSQLKFSVGVSMMIKVVGKVPLLIPSYALSLESFACEDFGKNSICDDFKLRDFPHLYPLQNVFSPSDSSKKSKEKNPCPHLFGDLGIEKYIVAGPLEVEEHHIYTWKIEIHVENTGYGFVHDVVMTDHFLLDPLLDFNILSTTQGTLSRESNNEIRWDIGTLDSNTTAVMVAEVRGAFYGKNVEQIFAENHHYNTISDGVKKAFTDGDELIHYGDGGIPNPEDVSFFNLFINGVLQPKTNYRVSPGLLTLTTVEAPLKGVFIVLEYLIIRDGNHQLLKGDLAQYNAISNEGHIYTNEDELSLYGCTGILDPAKTSYHHLFVNSVMQPPINYIIESGILILKTENAPIGGAPISIQFISIRR